MLTFRQFCELSEEMSGGASVAANNVGSGAIQGFTPPLITKKKKVKGTKSKSAPKEVMFRRVTPTHIKEDFTDDNHFSGAKVFVVSPEVYHKCRLGKLRYHRWDRYVGSDETGKSVAEYGKKNPKKPIVVQHSRTGEMMYLRNGNVHNWNSKK